MANAIRAGEDTRAMVMASSVLIWRAKSIEQSLDDDDAADRAHLLRARFVISELAAACLLAWCKREEGAGRASLAVNRRGAQMFARSQRETFSRKRRPSYTNTLVQPDLT